MVIQRREINVIPHQIPKQIANQRAQQRSQMGYDYYQARAENCGI